MGDVYYEVMREILLYALEGFGEKKSGEELVRSIPRSMVKVATTSMGAILNIVFRDMWEWIHSLAVIEDERRRALFEEAFFHTKTNREVSKDMFMRSPDGLYSSKS